MHNETIIKLAKAYVLKHGKMVNYGMGHVVKEVKFDGHLVEISIGSYYETMWIDKSQVI